MNWFAFDVKTGEYTRLSNTLGYDAEGSYSPDGQWIVFASNRTGYTDKLSDEQKKLFEVDPAWAMELYIMKSDGSERAPLDQQARYDGGPFFSPDGKQICWRRFSENGLTAEIMLMNVDGSDQRALNTHGAMSWAPYFHPSGDYLIFATNKHGFENFELYMVDAAGQQERFESVTARLLMACQCFRPKATRWSGPATVVAHNRNCSKPSGTMRTPANFETTRGRRKEIATCCRTNFKRRYNRRWQSRCGIVSRERTRHFCCRYRSTYRLSMPAGTRRSIDRYRR